MFCSNPAKSGSEGCTAMVLNSMGGGFCAFHCHQAKHNAEMHVQLCNSSFANWTGGYQKISVSPEFQCGPQESLNLQ